MTTSIHLPPCLWRGQGVHCQVHPNPRIRRDARTVVNLTTKQTRTVLSAIYLVNTPSFLKHVFLQKLSVVVVRVSVQHLPLVDGRTKQ
jgi:hypothetical protein